MSGQAPARPHSEGLSCPHCGQTIGQNTLTCPACGYALDPAASNWDRVAAMPKFRDMISAKTRFVVAATVFFVVYYFALPVLVGYAPQFMDRRVFGPVNIAYLFALSQFFVAWFLAWLYTRAASRFDRMSDEIVEDLNRGGR